MSKEVSFIPKELIEKVHYPQTDKSDHSPSTQFTDFEVIGSVEDVGASKQAN